MLDLLKLGLVLALTVALLTKKWDLGLVLLLDILLVALLFAYPPLSLLGSLWRGITSAQTLSLAGAVYLVLLLAELLRRTESTRKLVDSLQVVVPDNRLVLALIPLMIGLMPMLGGAMFSAPMVNSVGTQLQVSSERKTFVNYWFRHAMEYVFPLYSSVLMIAALLGISPYVFVRASWPLTAAALAGGVLWGLVGIARPERKPRPEKSVWRRAWRALFAGTWPLLLVVLAVVVLKADMLLSLAVVIGLTMVVHRIGPNQWLDVFKRSFPPQTFSAIFAVMAFKHVVEDAGAVQSIPAALSGLGLPALAIAFFVPHLSGLLTGTAAAAMALSVPLVAPVVDSQGLDLVVGGVWMFVGAFSGVLLSPLHLCLSLTRAYFRAAWRRLYLAIVPSTFLVVATALGIVLWSPKA